LCALALLGGGRAGLVESRRERRLTRKMATAGSAERPGTPAGAAAGTSRSGAGPGARCRPGSGPPEEDEPKKCAACAETRAGGSPACGHPACPLCLARRHSGGEERLRRRSDPERSSSRPGRRDCDSRRGRCVYRVNSRSHSAGPAPPLGNRAAAGFSGPEPELINEPSIYIKKIKMSPVVTLLLCRFQVGISHSFAAGILLSSENSRSLSAPITAPDRRLTWRAVLTSSTPLGLPPPRPERSISPESNDSISEELNHFKPIVCSPCTPPKRLPDGRLMEPTIVKSTPRNLTRGLQKATSYEASPAVLQKWRQIELDRQSLKVNSKATLTSPVSELHSKTNGGDDAAKTHPSPAGNRRRLLFDPPDSDAFQKQSVKIRVPAIRYSSDSTFRGSSESCTPESGSGGALFGRKQSFSPYTKNSGFQSCKLVPKDQQSPRKESDSSIHNQSTSWRGKKRKQKTKHLDPGRDSDLKRSRPVSQEAFDERYIRQLQQERQDRALALKLQRQFDLENQSVGRRRSPDTYFLRSWMSTQNRRRRGLRRSRRINKKH
uniref:RING-type E3 ubiquitin transferase n=1 Tax=Stegastes partitus TaxID=144197 RepID=A0A3B5B6L8_9TELE